MQPKAKLKSSTQDLLDRGRQDGEARGRCQESEARGPLSEATTARIQALPLEQLELLAVDAVFSEGVALLDFSGPKPTRQAPTPFGCERSPAHCTGRNLHVSTAVEPSIASADMVFLSVNTPTKARGIGAGDGRARRHQANPTQTGSDN